MVEIGRDTLFKLFKTAEVPQNKSWLRQWSPTGIVLTRGATQTPGDVIDDPLLRGYLTQLEDDGIVVEIDDGYLLSWDSLYTALDRPVYNPLRDILKIPLFTDARPILNSSHSLTDRDFSIALAGWQRNDGTRFDGQLIGPLMDEGDRKFLMLPQHWALFKEVVTFSRRSDDEREDLVHRQTWGRIRKLAVEAGALLDDFLYRSVVLTPEKLQIRLRRSDSVKDDRVIEIEPGFEGAPPGLARDFRSGSRSP
jgi:hypothetical protein